MVASPRSPVVPSQGPERAALLLGMLFEFELRGNPMANERVSPFHELAFLLHTIKKKSADAANFPNLFQAGTKWMQGDHWMPLSPSDSCC